MMSVFNTVDKKFLYTDSKIEGVKNYLYRYKMCSNAKNDKVAINNFFKELENDVDKDYANPVSKSHNVPDPL
jgi:hypothetical protein